MSKVEFDRQSLKISAKTDWADAEQFARVGNALRDVRHDGVAEGLPHGDNNGVRALTSTLEDYVNVMSHVALEYSDACSLLGSGQEEAISNYDAVERRAELSFAEMRARLGGEGE